MVYQHYYQDVELNCYPGTGLIASMNPTHSKVVQFEARASLDGNPGNEPVFSLGEKINSHPRNRLGLVTFYVLHK